jgi:hypothetical protein
MRWCRWIAVLAAISVSSALAGPVTAIETGGRGILTKCPSFFFIPFCHTYNHIKLPPRIAVGDTVPLTFGSNPKEYGFPVVRIVMDGSHCTIFSEDDDDPDQDKLDIKACHTAPR